MTDTVTGNSYRGLSFLPNDGQSFNDGSVGFGSKNDSTIETGSVIVDPAGGAPRVVVTGGTKLLLSENNVYAASSLATSGSAQSQAHGLGRVPGSVVVMVQNLLAAQAITITYGTATETNVVFTVVVDAGAQPLVSVLAF